MTGVADAPRRVVFAGDSITEWGRDRSDPDDVGTGYVGLLARGPLAGSTVHNTGVGGDRASDLLARWERDVLPFDADVLSLYVGVNDTWRALDAGERTPADAFEATLRALVAPWHEHGTRLVLVEPFALPLADAQAWADDLGPKQDAVARVAHDVGAAFVPLATVMADLADELGPRAVAPDGVHPSHAGHTAIARAWWDACSTLTPRTLHPEGEPA
ncbi:SGNH/GDSL hydrolase family protein [Cellulosimicrobium sp. PMB13]|uniref:SGNH/GDSL hydrolase family protein n=1 Tax=Cellulosimicrobium sp. PMB13 TaxID=3120158 RepID=UPI003F4C01CD